MLHLADSHIGADWRPRSRSRQPQRGDDLVNSYERVVALAHRHDVDLIVHAGDLFDLPAPSASMLGVAAAPLLREAARGVPVVIVPGNHERCTLPSNVLLAHPNIHLLAQAGTVRLQRRGVDIAVSGIPCIRREAAERFPPAASTCAEQARDAAVRLLVAHQAFDSAVCGAHHYRFRPGPDVVSRTTVPSVFQYVAAGHIHRHQVLEPLIPGGPVIAYAGSCDRIDFAERDEPKGAILAEFDGASVRVRFLEHEVRPMRLVSLDISGWTRDEVVAAVREELRTLPPGCVATLRLSGFATPGTLRGVNFSRLAASTRADVMLSTSVQNIEWLPLRAAAGRAARTSVFADIPSRDGDCGEVAIEEVATLPAKCGVYSFREQSGRLLYVGKSLRIRARVRSHLRTNAAGNFFVGWTRRIARVEWRLTGCDVEAELLEADLIRRFQPPFNRQMRLWGRACYLLHDRLSGGLALGADPCDPYEAIGPLRSRAAAQTVIDAVVRVRCAAPGALPPNVPASMSARHAALVNLIRGHDDALLVALEAGGDESPWARETAALRWMHDRSALLAAARRLLGATVRLKSGAVVRFEDNAVQWRGATERSTEDVSYERDVEIAGMSDEHAPLLPKSVADVLCVAARRLSAAPVNVGPSAD